MKSTATTLLTLAFIFTSVQTVLGQGVNVNGRVSDAKTGEGLPGVNVTVKGTATGTATDLSGAYSLRVPTVPAVLQFSFVGYVTQEVNVVESTTVINVQLEQDIAFLSDVVVVGSRFNPRSEFDSPVPIDNLPVEELETTGQLTLDQMMTYKVPSYNSTQQTVSDATALFNPADLRGLGPSRTLILVNGKRKNASSLVYINDTPGKGEVGVDMQSIPAAAVERIEVLRDGASAQYGSDAIAGVINIILKDDVDQTSVDFFSGVTSEGDGWNIGFTANTGFNIFGDGFVNVTTGYSWQDRTNRPGEPGRDDLFGVNPQDNPEFAAFFREKPDLGMQVGQPKMAIFDVFYNAGIPLSGGGTLYSFGGITYRDGTSYALHRTPYWIPDPFFIHHDQGDPYFGFHPTFETDIYDHTFGAGVRSQIEGWDVDVSATFGSNTVDYTIGESMNVDLGNLSPTTFNAGGYEFRNIVGNLDVFRAFGDFKIGFGSEFRTENFVTNAGEEDSYFGAGAQSFPGLQPRNEVDKIRSNIGVYGDVEYDYQDFLIGGAIRYEDYSDFGSTFNWKVNGRVRVADNRLVIRGSASTGFRAPSLHQLYLSNIQTLVSGGTVSNQGTFNTDSPVIRDLRVPQLKEEQALNITGGVAANVNDDLSLTVDGYWIRVDDRVVFTGEIFDADPSVQTPVDDILQAFSVTSLKFFTNAIDTETTGFDVVANYKNIPLGSGTLEVTLAGNYNETDITNDRDITTPAPIRQSGNVIFNRKEQSRVETARPQDKVTLSLQYNISDWSFIVSNTRFGEVTWRHADDPGKDQTFAAKLLTDVRIGFRYSEKVRLWANVNNVFDVYPDEIDPKGDVVTDLGGRFRYPGEVNQFGFLGTRIAGGVTLTF
ncbi:MAG: TonB-dependent receptor [Rhodothermales bacterium]|nr:TonB-dependent receptor [Rhodothermales bacterium]